MPGKNSEWLSDTQARQQLSICLGPSGSADPKWVESIVVKNTNGGLHNRLLNTIPSFLDDVFTPHTAEPNGPAPNYCCGGLPCSERVSDGSLSGSTPPVLPGTTEGKKRATDLSSCQAAPIRRAKLSCFNEYLTVSGIPGSNPPADLFRARVQELEGLCR